MGLFTEKGSIGDDKILLPPVNLLLTLIINFKFLTKEYMDKGRGMS